MVRKTRQFRNLTRNTDLATCAQVADNFVTRFAGLLFSAPLQPGEGLLITPCNSIHMFWMRFAIDVVFFDKDWQVVGLVRQIKPWRISPFFKAAESCLELPPGVIAATGTEVGDRIAMSIA